uniref:Uncharacterized protein n=1 Tax=viral metagenome TaxID=1070528 RepID=A0A6M3LDF1_9ZZZZ
MNTKIQIDHESYQRKCKLMTNEELRYTIKDARLAIKAMPNNPKAEYYQDEVHYCAMELRRRGF